MSAQSQNVSPVVVWRCSNYHPSIWGNHFLSYASECTNTNAYLEQQVQQLKEEVRKMLIIDDDDSEQKSLLIDAIQRLGVAYHIESEIDEALQLVFDGYIISTKEDDDVYTTAL